MDRSSKVGMVIICLFALPFAGFGVMAIVSAISQIVSGTGAPSVWLLILFGLVFCAIGFGLIFGTVAGGRILERKQRLTAEHPSEPWLWREDWARGRVQSKTRSGMIGGWIFAVLWNAVSAPILVFLPEQAAKEPVAYIGFVFPLVGIVLLVRAIRMTLAYTEFGKTWFEMSAVPGVIGGELKGTILTRFPHGAEHGVQLRLTCVLRTVSGSGNSRSVSESIKWRSETRLDATQLYPSVMGVSIPVSFKIPRDALATNTNPSGQIFWQLEALADVPGVDYHDVFEVPVFRTSQTPTEPLPQTAPEVMTVKRPPALTAVVTPTSSGTEFYFPPARNKTFAMATSGFFLIFGSISVFLFMSKAPLIFPVAFGFFTLLLLYISVQMWFGTTRVGIAASELLLQDGYFGGGKVKRFTFPEVESIRSRITSQQGSGTGTPYYDIEMTLRSGKKVTLARTIRNKEEVDWLVSEIRRTSGLQQKAAGAGV